MMRRRLMGILIALAALLAACGGDSPEPQGGDPAVLTGFDALPKEIATVEMTITPTAVLIVAETVDVAQPTATPAPPRPTATLTPYAGIFMGEPTSESGEGGPADIPTLVPYVFDAAPGGSAISGGGVVPPSSGGSGACSVPVAPAFANAYNTNPSVPQRLGCPITGGMAIELVTQPFERGEMYWRSTRQIYALAHNGQFWQLADSWEEGMPSDDPAFAAPSGLIQPVRGFGLAWRSNQPVRDALGWGLLHETPFGSTWQDFERGAMFTGSGGRVYAIYTAEGQHSGPLAP
ncbi:MAG: hypothetical protein GXY36_13940 [Chloroflexi bacterium]|nr:hypothetical protein [Chloroflexota bacterium]